MPLSARSISLDGTFNTSIERKISNLKPFARLAAPHQIITEQTLAMSHTDTKRRVWSLSNPCAGNSLSPQAVTSVNIREETIQL